MSNIEITDDFPENVVPASPTKDEESEKDTRRINIVEGRAHEFPYLVANVSFFTDAATQIVRFSFRRLNQSLAMAEHIIKRQGTKEEYATFMTLVEKIFSEKEKELDNYYKQIKTTLAQNARENLMVSYDQKRRLEVPYSTPLGLRFLKIVKKFDSCLSLVETCWLSQLIEDKDRDEIFQKWESSFRKIEQDIFTERAGIISTISQRRSESRSRKAKKNSNGGKRRNQFLDQKVKEISNDSDNAKAGAADQKS